MSLSKQIFTINKDLIKIMNILSKNILNILGKTNMSIKIFDTKINSEEYKLDFEEIKI